MHVLLVVRLDDDSTYGRYDTVDDYLRLPIQNDEIHIFEDVNIAVETVIHVPQDELNVRLKLTEPLEPGSADDALTKAGFVLQGTEEFGHLTRLVKQR